MENYRTVLFDLDGTLLDTSPGLLKAIDVTLETCGLPSLSPEQKHSMIGPPIERSLQAICSLTPEEANRAAGIFRSVYADQFLLEADPYPGISALLSRLKHRGWQIGVATYKRIDYTRPLLEKKGLLSLCDSVCGSLHAGQTKADIIRLCLKELGSRSDTALLVGDTFHDLIGARETGCAFIGVSYGFGFRTREEILQEGVLAAAESVSELEHILNGLYAPDTVNFQ